jgi:hypothetical protein
MLQDLARRHKHHTSFKAAILEVLKETENRHLDPDRFHAYFAQDIEKFFPVSTDEGTDEGIENANYSDKKHPHPEEPTCSLKERKYESKSDAHPNRSFTHRLDDANAHLSTSEVVLDKASDLEDLANDFLNKNEQDISEYHSKTQASYANTPQHTDPELELRVEANQKAVNNAFTLRSVLSLGKKGSSQNTVDLTDSVCLVVDGLLKTHTTTEFLMRINEAMKRTDLEQPLREILLTLKELTNASNASLSMLKTTVARRFKLDKAS